jgi:hypothetical protein
MQCDAQLFAHNPPLHDKCIPTASSAKANARLSQERANLVMFPRPPSALQPTPRPSSRALPRHVREGLRILGRHVVSSRPLLQLPALDISRIRMPILARSPPNKLFDLIRSIMTLCAGSLASLRGSSTKRDETRLGFSLFEDSLLPLERAWSDSSA